MTDDDNRTPIAKIKKIKMKINTLEAMGVKTFRDMERSTPKKVPPPTAKEAALKRTIERLEWQMDSSKKLKAELDALKSSNLKAMAEFQEYKHRTLGIRKPSAPK